MNEHLKEVLDSVTKEVSGFYGRTFIDKGHYRIAFIESKGDSPVFWIMIIDPNNQTVIDIKEESIKLDCFDYERVRQFLLGLQELLNESDIPSIEALLVRELFPIKALSEAVDCYIAPDFKDRLKANKYLGRVLKL